MAPLLWWQQLAIDVVKVIVVFSVLLLLFSVMTWVERRVLAFMQFRLGPNRTGPFGILQPIADGIKLFFKEELIPEGANRVLFFLAPAVAVVTAFLAVAVVPYGGTVTLPQLAWLPSWLAWLWPEWIRGREITLQIADLNVGLLFIFAVTSLGVYGIVMAGWSSNNKYTLLGGLRSAAQMFSYELALGLSFVGVIMLAGSLRISDIVAAQAGLFTSWNCFRQLPAFLIYVVAATAEVNRTPFDLPEGETELVAGFHTEYSSMKFALLQMAEYVNMITVAALTANLFLGGWNSGLPGILPSAGLFGVLWFVLKMLAVLFFFIWLRGTLPRFRYDQLMHFGWKALVPAAAAWILITAGYLAFYAGDGAARAGL
jgi:NADH-quinone oxidoreductase subunit H